MELTQLYFKLFPSVCLAQLWVVVCLKQAVSLVQEKPAVSRLLPTSGWQPSQNVPAGGRQGGGRDRKGRRESFSFLLQKTILLNIRSKSLQGLMGVTYFLEWWRGPELIIMKIMLRNTYNGFLVGMTAGLRSCFAFIYTKFHLSFPSPPSYLGCKRPS